jgi:hypothetical protein
VEVKRAQPFGSRWERSIVTDTPADRLLACQALLRAHLDQHRTAGEARRRISGAYLEYARYYLRARDGLLAGEPDPESW